jgi:thiamine biosynthesis lipoprotein
MRAACAAFALLPAFTAGFESPVQEAPQASEDVLREWRGGVMGTSFLVEAIGPDPAALDAAIEACIAEVRRVEDAMTTWRESELTRLNERAGQGPIEVSPELCELVARAVEISRLTEGAFDPTWYPLGRLWDFKADPPVLPDPDAVERARAYVDAQRIRVDLEQHTVELPAGFSIELGGIAKGWGVDRGMRTLMDHGVRHGVVDAGGDLKALGAKFDAPWQIAIKHPRRREEVLAVIPVSNRCVVTSGDYERFFEVDGRRYHHILDPRTGLPSTGCMSATVVGPDAAFCDALATAMCVLGPERGMPIVEGLERVEALLVDMDGEVHVSSGLR